MVVVNYPQLGLIAPQVVKEGAKKTLSTAENRDSASNYEKSAKSNFCFQ